MALKMIVKVGKISNLSDARYCAGMGVDMLGFRVDESDLAFVPPPEFQEMRGWFSGPSIVAELTDSRSIDRAIPAYAPDYLEVDVAELPSMTATGLPLMVRGSTETLAASRTQLEYLSGRIAFVIVPLEETPAFKALCNNYPVLVQINDVSQLATLQNLPIRGIALEGGHEERPGMKDYENISEILEALEND